MSSIDILHTTKKVEEYLEKTVTIYENARATGQEGDFYKDVKPFVEEVHALLEEWCQSAGEWVTVNKPRNIFIQQVDAAKDNFKEICVQAFFPKTSYSRFKHNVNSIHYTLEKLITEIEKAK